MTSLAPAEAARSFRRHVLIMELGAFLVSVGLLLFIMRRLLFTGELTLRHDNIFWAYPVFSYWADGVLHGHLPLWNPFSHGGEPLFVSYLQLRLFDPLNYLVIWVGGWFTDDLTILFNWWWLERCLVAALGTQLLLRRWAKNPYTRATLAPIAVLSSPMLSSFHQFGVLDQFYCAPLMLFFLFRLLDGKHGWANWMGLCFFLGPTLQSYFFVGSITAILTVLLGYAIFLPRPLLALLSNRANWLKAAACLLLFLAMAAPNIAIYLQQGQYHFTAHNIPLNWEASPPNFPNYDLAPDESVSVLNMPYGVIRLTGAASEVTDLLGLLAPPPIFLPYVGETYLYFGGLAFVVALIGIFCGRHRLKGPWLMVLVLFGFLMLGPNTPVHWLLFQIYPPLWFLRNTEQLSPFFLLALMFFFVLGADRVLTFRRPLFKIPPHSGLLHRIIEGRLTKLWTFIIDGILLVGATIYALPISNPTVFIWIVGEHQGLSWTRFFNRIFLARVVSRLYPFDDPAAFIPFLALLAVIGAREVGIAKQMFSRAEAVILWWRTMLVAILILGIVGLRKWFPTVPVGQPRRDWLAMLIEIMLVIPIGWRLGGLVLIPILASMMAAEIRLTIDSSLYTLWVSTLLVLPALTLYLLHIHGSRTLRSAAGAILLLVTTGELASFTRTLRQTEAWTQTRVAKDWPVTLGDAAFPVTRVATIPMPPAPSAQQPELPGRLDNPEPVRYPELLVRQGVAFDTPRTYPEEAFINDAAHVLAGRRWNTFAVLNPYSRLIYSGLNADVIGSVFAVDAPIFQFRPQAVATDDFIADIGRLPPREAISRLATTVFLDRDTLPPQWRPTPSGAAAQPARIVTTMLDYDRVALTVTTAQPGYLSIADTYSPDWHATVDGTPVPILRANGNFKAIAIAPGTSSVTLTYHPPLTIWCLRLFFAAFLIAALIAIADVIPKRRNRSVTVMGQLSEFDEKA